MGGGSAAGTTLPIGAIDGKSMHPDIINPAIKAAQYAVRGELYLRGEELRKEGKEIVAMNIGNPQALGLKPNSYNREVLALVIAPSLMDNPNVGKLFPSDVILRAKEILSYMPNGLGAYSDSRGVAGIRKEVADYIAGRDGFPCDPDMIYLTDGASPAVKLILNSLIRDASDGILCPIPQYPLYSASVAVFGGTLVPYYLNEEKGWGCDIDELERAISQARSEGVVVRALAVINPGNPTGQCLDKDNMQEILKFCKREQILMMADEVYQENIYNSERPFVSFKKALMEMGAPLCNEIELVSFHTISKGYLGECGLRGGYMEMVNIHPDSVAELYKMSSVGLCPNLVGQVGMALQVNPPKKGSESYGTWNKQKQDQLDSLRRRAQMVTDGWNSLEGVTCNITEGAMYSFPNISIPPKAQEAAKAKGKTADFLYCLELLEETGLSTVPGAGFGQKPGTFHLRTTILPLEEKMPSIIAKLKTFHEAFMDRYR